MSNLGIKATGLSYNYIEQVAKTIRDSLAVKDKFPAHKLELIVNLLTKGNCQLHVDNSMREEGKTFITGDAICLREDVYDNLLNHELRARFTSLHELAHRILHCRPNSGIAQCRTNNIPKYCDPEWQADALAGALLCPAEQIKKLNLSIDNIMDRYLVSRPCAEKRLSVMGKITL